MSLEDFKVKVSKINNTAGNFPRNPDEGSDYWDALQRQAEITQLELNEVFTAIENRDMVKLRDGVADVNVCNFGVAHIGSLPMTDDSNEVVDCLFSRFAVDADHVEETQRKYADIGVKTRVRYSEDTDRYVVLSSENQVGTDGESYPEGKFLKAVGFNQPTFKPM